MFDIKMSYIFFSNFITALLSALPFTPGGIGIGELSFIFINNNFFNIYLTNLANIILFFRIIVLISTLPGLILYVKYKRKNFIN